MDVNDVDPGGATLATPPTRRGKRKRETINYVVDVPQELDDSLHAKGGVPERAVASLPLLPTRKRRTRKKANSARDVPMELSDDTPHKKGEGMDGEGGLRMPGEATVSLTPPAKRKRRNRSVVNAVVDIPMELLHEEDEEMEAESVHVMPGEAATPVRRKRPRRKVDPVPCEPDDPPQLEEEGGDGETEVESANASAMGSTTPPPPPRRSTRARGTVNYVVDVPLDLDDE